MASGSRGASAGRPHRPGSRRSSLIIRWRFSGVDGALNPAPEVLLELTEVAVEPVLDFNELEELEVELGEEEGEPIEEEFEQALDGFEPAPEKVEPALQ